jgi:transcription elongation factor
MKSVREQETKNTTLRARLVGWIEASPRGEWTLGSRIVENVKRGLGTIGVHTTGEVLAKELRKAQRKGEIRKRINGDRMVEYTAIAPAGMLFDPEAKVDGETVTGERDG